MALDDTATMLPCGRDALAVVDDARTGLLDDHERSCRYCLAAQHAADLALQAARELDAQPVDVPAGLLPAVMRTVWAELRPSPLIPLPAPAGGAAVSALAVATALRTDLDTVDNLSVYTCQVEPSQPTSRNGRPAALEIHLTASTRYPSPLPPLADLCRARITATLRTQFGLAAAGVDIDFIDLDPPEVAQ